MGRCGGWMKIIVLVLAAFIASCGDTGGKSSDSGKPFVFEARGRLNLIAQPVVTTPTVLTIIATLLDPQGNPFRNQRVTFEAEFRDATIVPADTPQNAVLTCLPPGSSGNTTRCTNRGASITDDLGQAQVTVIAGLTLGRMRLTAEAPANLNISSAISVNITSQGFIGGTALAILPTSLTFINPQVEPGRGAMATFIAVGGTPPYRWENTNKDLARIDPQGTFNERVIYTLIGPIPTDTAAALLDTVILIDSTGARLTATVTVIFAECDLRLSVTDINFNNARGEETFDIEILDGVPPFTATHTFPVAGTLLVDNATEIITYKVAKPPFPVNPDNVIIRDGRGCVGTVNVNITPASVNTLTLTATPATVPNIGGPVTITAFAFDSNNRPFEGATVVFSTDGGSLDPVSDDTNPEGIATTALTITGPTTATSITVTATSQGQTATTTITIEPPPPPPPPPPE